MQTLPRPPIAPEALLKRGQVAQVDVAVGVEIRRDFMLFQFPDIAVEIRTIPADEN